MRYPEQPRYTLMHNPATGDILAVVQDYEAEKLGMRWRVVARESDVFTERIPTPIEDMPSQSHPVRARHTVDTDWWREEDGA